MCSGIYKADTAVLYCCHWGRGLLQHLHYPQDCGTFQGWEGDVEGMRWGLLASLTFQVVGPRKEKGSRSSEGHRDPRRSARRRLGLHLGPPLWASQLMCLLPRTGQVLPFTFSVTPPAYHTSFLTDSRAFMPHSLLSLQCCSRGGSRSINTGQHSRLCQPCFRVLHQ